MIFRDHWQGEFSVALFGAMGLSLLSMVSPNRQFDDPRYRILREIMPEKAWELMFLFAGALQLYGLYCKSSWYRVIGAFCVFLGLVCVVQSIVITAPWQLSIAMYAACIFTELCAIIFQTASIVRSEDYPRWWKKWIYRR